ncbi:hypothetical protein B0H13DRAFT_2300191 [Mycena leptocephala]|nr:hypothetical protein B0H13DRAFT_2300191 [Mycena leptocephala]
MALHALLIVVRVWLDHVFCRAFPFAPAAAAGGLLAEIRASPPILYAGHRHTNIVYIEHPKASVTLAQTSPVLTLRGQCCHLPENCTSYLLTSCTPFIDENLKKGYIRPSKAPCGEQCL